MYFIITSVHTTHILRIYMKLCTNVTTYVTTCCATQSYKMCYTKLQMKLGTHTLHTSYVSRVMCNNGANAYKN